MCANRPSAPMLGGTFDEAFVLASELHRSHRRKGTTIPYVSHLMAVASFVLEDGGDEEEAIAALLHDALEDCPDQASAGYLETRFGPRVRSIVEACTDTPPDFAGGSKPPWRERKEAYLEHILSGDAWNSLQLAVLVHPPECPSGLRGAEAGVWRRRPRSSLPSLAPDP